MKEKSVFKKIAEKYSTPHQVQKFLRTLDYNSADTMFSAVTVLEKGRAHCMEAAMCAAAILEHQGYPPLVISFESVDDLDHVIAVFHEQTGWGAIGRSRDHGLHGRRPIFKTLRDLAESYLEPYVDKTGRVEAFGVAHLDDSGVDWRWTPGHVWAAEKFLIDLTHKPLRMRHSEYLGARKIYETSGHQPRHFWW